MVRERVMVKCESFDAVNSDLLEMVKNALMLGLKVECAQYGKTYMVSIFK